ncbi:MAG: cobalt-precorrin-5B (C(1))-methyltransferase CbiD, partial [Candidatus Geothermincolales bacterium]
AAAAAKAAALALFRGHRPRVVTVDLPRGGQATVPISKLTVRRKACACTVRKEGSEKGDVTAGMLLVATVIKSEAPGIRVDGGKGVGLVTRPGLDVPVGERAINPIPRHMIASGVSQALGDYGKGRGCRVVISVPEGRQIATRTLNGRLGIAGGISILGTTGIQVPYSTRAFLDSIGLSLRVARHSADLVVLSTGRHSEDSARRYLDLPEELFVLCGDHVGWAIRKCVKSGFDKVLLWSMPAKMAKLAEGKRNLNWRRGLPDVAWLASMAVGKTAMGKPAVFDTVHGLLEAMEPHERRRVLSLVCRLASISCEDLARGSLRVFTAVVNRQGFLEAAWPPWPWPVSSRALPGCIPGITSR